MKWVIPIIVLAAIAGLVSHIALNSDLGSINWWLVIIIVSIIILAIIIIKYREKIPMPKIYGMNPFSFAWISFKSLTKGIAVGIIIILAVSAWYYWPSFQRERQKANQPTVTPAPYVQADNTQIVAGPGSDDDPIVQYGHHRFEKGVWYRYLVADNRKYYFTHKLDETIVEYRPFGNGDVWYEVRFSNQSDDVEVTSKRP